VRDAAAANTAKTVVDITAPASDVTAFRAVGNWKPAAPPVEVKATDTTYTTNNSYVRINPGADDSGKAIDYFQGEYTYNSSAEARFSVSRFGSVNIRQGDNETLTAPAPAALTVQACADTVYAAGGIASFKNSAGSVVVKFDKDGNITSPTITSLQSADTSLGNRVTTLENTPTPGASATKDGKRVHWGTFSVTTDASGFATVTHGAGFTPTAVLMLSTAAVYQLQADTLGATTFRLRATDAGGSVGAFSISGYYFCGE
jgi:hypothetical protein